MLIIGYSSAQILQQPEDISVCEHACATFRVITNPEAGNLDYKWQEYDGTGWQDLNESDNYIGINTYNLIVCNSLISQNGYKYRVIVADSSSAGDTSNAAILIINPNPETTIQAGGTFPLICSGSSMLIDGNPSAGSGIYTNHEWSGDTYPLSVVDKQTTVFQSLVSGEYILTYRVTDSKGCSATDTDTIINENAGADFTIDPTTSCGDVPFNFINTSEDARRYEWYIEDPNGYMLFFEEENPSVKYFNPTDQVMYLFATLMAYSENDCMESVKKVFTIYPSTEASFTTSKIEGCSPLTVDFNAGSGSASYEWDIGDNSIEFGYQTISHEFINNTFEEVKYSVRLTTSSFYGCYDFDSVEITVYPTPEVEIITQRTDDTWPVATIEFSSFSLWSSSYQWDFGNGSTSFKKNPVFTYYEPGYYEVVLTAFSSHCENKDTLELEIFPSKPIVDFPDPYCVGGDEVVLTEMSREEHDTWCYETWWYDDSGLEDYLGAGQSIRFSMPDDRDTIYVVNYYGKSLSKITEVFLVLRPTISLNDNILEIDAEEGVHYRWYYNGAYIENDSPALTSLGDGLYYVSVLINECVATSRPTEIVNGEIVGFQSIKIPESIKIYPNPSKSIINITVPEFITDEFEIYIYDMSGIELMKQVVEYIIGSHNYSFDISNFSAGLYLLKISSQYYYSTNLIIKE